MILISLEDDCDGPPSGTPFLITVGTDSNGMATFTGTFASEDSGSFVSPRFRKSTPNLSFDESFFHTLSQPVRRMIPAQESSNSEQVTSEAEQLARAAEEIVRDDPLQAALLVEVKVAAGNSGLMVKALEVMDPTRAGKMIDVMNADVAAALWGVMDFVKAGPVMNGIVTERATQIVSVVPDPNLLGRMPEVTPTCMWEIPLQLLIDTMPSPPVPHLWTSGSSPTPRLTATGPSLPRSARRRRSTPSHSRRRASGRCLLEAPKASTVYLRVSLESVAT